MRAASTLTSCHGPQQRAIQAMKDSLWRVDTRLLDGPVKPGHDNVDMKAA